MRCEGTNTEGLPCKNSARHGRNYCSYHGGNRTVGQLVPNASAHTKYINNIPVQDRPFFLARLNDPNLTSCSSELAFVDIRLGQLAAELEDTSSKGLTWKEAGTQFSKLLLNMDRPDQFLKGSEELLKMMREGQSRDHVWGQAQQALEMRRKIAETETKRDIALNQTIPKGAVADVLTHLCDAFRRNVLQYADRELANKILSASSRELSRIIATGGMGILMSGGGPGVAGSPEEDINVDEQDIFA